MLKSAVPKPMLFCHLAFALLVPLFADADLLAQDVRCVDLFHSGVQSEAVRKIVSQNALSQWRRWEETSNHFVLLKPTTPVAFQQSRVPLADVEIWTANLEAEKIAARFVRKSYVLYPKHPYNQDSNVPFAGLPNTATPMMMYMTASRSASPVKFGDITVKTGTDHPHGPGFEYEPRKVRTDEDIRGAILRSKHFGRVDREMSEDSVLIMLPEVVAMIDRQTRNGILVRDISRLDDGRYYLPAFAIPYAGREIAAVLGVNFEDFFGEAYAKTSGRAKARKLLRYGTQMETPNTQNLLIPLTRNLEFTGQLVVRDTPDSRFVEPVAIALGFAKEVEADRAAGIEIDSKAIPDWRTSTMLLEEAGSNSVSTETLEHWEHLHDMSYISEIETALGVSILIDKAPWSAFRRFWFPTTMQPISILNAYLISDEGQAALRKYASHFRPVNP